MISYTANFIASTQSQLNRAEATGFANIAPYTKQGLLWAIDFVKSLNKEQMTERELKHACRLSTFRGQTCPVFK